MFNGALVSIKLKREFGAKTFNGAILVKMAFTVKLLNIDVPGTKL